MFRLCTVIAQDSVLVWLPEVTVTLTVALPPLSAVTVAESPLPETLATELFELTHE